MNELRETIDQVNKQLHTLRMMEHNLKCQKAILELFDKPSEKEKDEWKNGNNTDTNSQTTT